MSGTYQVEGHGNTHVQMFPVCKVVTSPGRCISMGTDKRCPGQHKRSLVLVSQQHAS